MEKQVSETVFDISNPWSTNVPEFIAMLQAKYESIPEHLRHTAHIEAFVEDEDYCTLTMGYSRPENEQEKANRVARDEMALAFRREQYERMKKEFGDA